MTAETIARSLGGYKSGAGWMARCPAHNDRVPSLSISDSPDGKVLIHCNAGCDQQSVIRAFKSLCLWDGAADSLAPTARADEIGAASGRNGRQTHHLLAHGEIQCARKVRGRWVVNRSALLREFGG